MVAHQRESPAGKLDPDLVTSAGMEPHADQTGFACGKPLEFQPCLFYATPLTLHHKDFVLFAVLPKQVFPVAAFRRGAVDHSHIFLHHGAFLHCFGQGCGGLLCPGVYHHTAHIFI